MSELKMGAGKHDEWYTPPEIFEAFDTIFDLDPCSPGADHWVPAIKVFTKKDDSLNKKWNGFIFMNPPFGGRNGHVPWLKKFIEHGNGIGLSRAYTSSGWFHEYMPKTEILLFPKGKTQFVRADGSIGKSPSSGIVLFGIGAKAIHVLKNCDLGICLETDKTNHQQR